jgi:hypothetical protein
MNNIFIESDLGKQNFIKVCLVKEVQEIAVDQERAINFRSTENSLEQVRNISRPDLLAVSSIGH